MKNNTIITTTSQSLAGELKKSSLLYTVIYTILLCIVASLLIFCYFSVFTTYFYPKSFNGKYLVGVVDTSNYHQTQSGQVLHIEQYSKAGLINVGDEIFYSGNSGEGSAIVVENHYAQGYISVKLNDSTTNIALSTIIGKVVNKTEFWGYVLWFLQSWVGVISLNVLLIFLVLSRTLFVYNVETSAKGKELKLKLKQQNKAEKRLKKIQKNYKNTGLDLETFEMLSGDFNENATAIQEFSKRNDIKNAYAYLLKKVHRVYISKPKITTLDRLKITNCIELMCLVGRFDIDSEYLLTDLILKTHAVNFDKDNFVNSCINYLNAKHTTEDLSYFLSVLYVL